MQTPGNNVHHVTLTVLLILACTTAYATTPGEEHTYAIFQDDFEEWDETAWELNIGPNASYGAYWKLLDDDGNKVLSVKGTVGVAAGAPYWTDYTVIVRVKLVDAPEDVKIAVRRGESGEEYSVGFSLNEMDLIKSPGWETEPICLSKFGSSFSSDTWYTVKIVCVGNMLWVYVDDELKFEYEDETEPVLSGRIGFGCGPNTNVYIDDVWVAVTHTGYVGHLITGAQLIIDQAKALDADVIEPESMLNEARAKFNEGELGAAEPLAVLAAQKAKGLLELATSEAQEPQQETQQQPAQTAPPLSIERVATIITIGGAVTGGAGWALKARGDRRKRAILFNELMQATDDIYQRHRSDPRQCETELLRMKDRAINEYKKNLITEKDYHTLNQKIKEHTTKLNEPTTEQ
ncbi:MAG: hypothetical protein ABIJ47_03670 [Candidatus Bathyarchaeota archaeon]